MISEINFNYIYLVVDMERKWVYCEANSNSHAQSVRNGLINGLVKLFKKPDIDVNFNDPNKHYYINFVNDEVFEIEESALTPEWVKARALVLTKAQCILKLQELIHLRQMRIDDHLGTGAMEAFLWKELQACKPEEGFYTTAIIEWAHLNDTPVEVSYQELKMRSEGIGLVLLRCHALYQKYVTLINQCPSVVDIHLTYDDLFKEIYLTSNV